MALREPQSTNLKPARGSTIIFEVDPRRAPSKTDFGRRAPSWARAYIVLQKDRYNLTPGHYEGSCLFRNGNSLD